MDPNEHTNTQPQEKDGYAAAVAEFLGTLNASTRRIGADRQLTAADFYHCLVNTFGSPDGAIVLAWLHTTAATNKPAFLPGDRDPYAASSRDGRKSLVWEIEANLASARAGLGTADSKKPKATGSPRAGRKRA